MYELIEHKKLEAAAASITFSNIPQIYTDLLLVTSLRDDSANAGWATAEVRPNGATTNISARVLYGWSTNVGSFTDTQIYHQLVRGASTASTFSNSSVYIPNYRSSTSKSFSVDTSGERNDVASINAITAGLWSVNDPITSLSIVPPAGSNLAQYSSATLYGINRNSAIGRPKAVGGNITYANGYWVHTFTGSGSFYAQEDLDLEYLVIAGGGGGGASLGVSGGGGGGGAGGYRSFVAGELSGGLSTGNSFLKVSAMSSHPVLVGAGGTGGSPGNRGANGGDSAFSQIASLGGGAGGGGLNQTNTGLNGGSGGGMGALFGGTNVRGLGTTNQGFNGGATSGSRAGAGGGGAGSAGTDIAQSGFPAGVSGTAGGAGISSSITGTLVARGGGGGGGSDNASGGPATAGGGSGGNASAGVAGTAYTGGGGGAGGTNSSPNIGNTPGGNGGSGVVIVRYRA